MRYKIGQSSNEKELTLSLSITLFSDGVGIVLKGTNEKNMTWNILGFCSDGTFFRYKGLPDDIGLQVDDKGRIKLEELE